MQIVFKLLISCFLISFSFLVLMYFMADVPVAKRARCALGTVCDACGKTFATSDGFDKYRTSGYLIGTPCHVLDDESTRMRLESTARVTISTAMLQTLKVARRKHVTATSGFPDYLWCLCCLFHLFLLRQLNPEG
jgi:hypothetical protein